jgi:hypothetical protein
MQPDGDDAGNKNSEFRDVALIFNYSSTIPCL